MKKYTLEWALLKPRMTRAIVAKPFPGKYPTRVAWKGIRIGGKPFSYIGKPTRAALAERQKAYNTYMLKELISIEFDRNGLIAYDQTCAPPMKICRTASVRAAYHPFPEDGTKFFTSGSWKEVQNGKIRQMVFWPDSLLYTTETAGRIGYTLPPQLQQQIPVQPLVPGQLYAQQQLTQELDPRFPHYYWDEVRAMPNE